MPFNEFIIYTQSLISNTSKSSEESSDPESLPMKILYYFYELDTHMYLWQRNHFIDELKRHDIEFITFNPAKYESMERANEEFIDFAKSLKGQIDLFLSCDETKILFPETVKAIKSILSVPTVLICWDNLELPYKQKRLAKEFDLIWLTSYETEYLFKSWGCKTIFQTYAANPYFFRRFGFFKGNN